MSAGVLLQWVRQALGPDADRAVGAVIGTDNDRMTWRIRWDGTETPANIATAQAVIDSIDFSGNAVVGARLDDEIESSLLVQALAWATHDELVVLGSLLTRSVFRANIRDRYRQLRGL